MEIGWFLTKFLFDSHYHLLLFPHLKRGMLRWIFPYLIVYFCVIYLKHSWIQCFVGPWSSSNTAKIIINIYYIQFVTQSKFWFKRGVSSVARKKFASVGLKVATPSVWWNNLSLYKHIPWVASLSNLNFFLIGGRSILFSSEYIMSVMILIVSCRGTLVNKEFTSKLTGSITLDRKHVWSKTYLR